MLRSLLPAVACFALAPAVIVAAQTAQPAPPKTWVDKDTGHRVWRLTDEPNSGGFYFNVNGYTPDHKTMIYTAPDGIHAMDMETMKTRLLVPNPPRPAAVRLRAATPESAAHFGRKRQQFHFCLPVKFPPAFAPLELRRGKPLQLLQLSRF